MCKHCCEEYIPRTECEMLICKLLKEQGRTDIETLCICQRYCSEKNKYIPYNQEQGCKNYEWENISVLLGRIIY